MDPFTNAGRADVIAASRCRPCSTSRLCSRASRARSPRTARRASRRRGAGAAAAGSRGDVCSASLLAERFRHRCSDGGEGGEDEREKDRRAKIPTREGLQQPSCPRSGRPRARDLPRNSVRCADTPQPSSVPARRHGLSRPWDRGAGRRKLSVIMKDIVIIDAVRARLVGRTRASLAQKAPGRAGGRGRPQPPRTRNPKVSVRDRGLRPWLRDAGGGSRARTRRASSSCSAGCRRTPGADHQSLLRVGPAGDHATAAAARSRWAPKRRRLRAAWESMSMVPMTGNKLSASPEAMEQPASVHADGHHGGERGPRSSTWTGRPGKFALRNERTAPRRSRRRPSQEIALVTAYKYVGEEKKFTFEADEPRVRTRRSSGLPASLKPAFATVRLVTANNSSPASDGGSGARGERREGEGPRRDRPGYLRAFATVGVDPAIMGIGPVPAIASSSPKTG